MSIVKINPMCESIFGYTEEEILFKHIRLLLPKKAKTPHLFFDEAMAGTHITDSYKPGKLSSAVRKDGRELMIELRMSSLKFNGHKSIILFIKDVTELVKDKQQISTQIKKFKAIAWQHSHVIRRPLANI
ncbi:MAG: PAS domain S-box protein, partial [Sediminibacterium sp.]|nr:PAS domain S-box protein [Sediminibacterium sp.]